MKKQAYVILTAIFILASLQAFSPEVRACAEDAKIERCFECETPPVRAAPVEEDNDIDEEDNSDEPDFMDALSKILDEVERQLEHSEILKRLHGFESGLIKALLEKRDFHYSFTLGNIEYEISAMNRHRLEVLDLKVENISPAMEAQLGLEGKGGVLVVEVGEDGLAAKAGLKKYDILMSIGESDVPGIDRIDKVLGALPAEKELTCNIIRNAKEKEIKMTLPKGLRNGNEPENDREEDADGNDEEQND